MSTAEIILFIVCGVLAVACVKLKYDVWRTRGDSNFWHKLYTAQVNYACRADQRIAELEHGAQRLQFTISELRRALGKPR